MLPWIPVIPVGASLGILCLIFIICTHQCFTPKQPKDFTNTNPERHKSLQNGISKLHDNPSLHQQVSSNKKGRTNSYVFRNGFLSRSPLFSWGDHPSLVTDAVENGWSRFGFTTPVSSTIVRSARALLEGCVANDHGREMKVEISWEVCQGSVDFMQKIRVNSILTDNTINSLSVIRTSLPLPGPPLGNSSFPQEAYFEITILSSDEENNLVGKVKKSRAQSEETKPIKENFDENSNSESSIHSTDSYLHDQKKLEELKVAIDEKRHGKAGMLSLGLTGGGPLPLKLPGSYPGSIGFNSDGSVYLDGMKLVFESEKSEWGRINKVIGCGYNPSQRKVFFTVDSELLHLIHCKSEEFGTPLYPALATNTETMVLVNFGQSAFKYAPANAQRTPNPCFICPLSNSPTLGYEDSKELFSMGRIDSQWNRSTPKNTCSVEFRRKMIDSKRRHFFGSFKRKCGQGRDQQRVREYGRVLSFLLKFLTSDNI